MSERLRESVSALVDGEVEEFELRKLLASDDFGSVRTAWRDFQALGGSLTGVDQHIAGLDISGRVMSALEAEPALLPATRQSRWWRPVASVAVAASMAAVVVVGVRGFGGGDQSAPQVVAVEPLAAGSGKVYPTPANARVVGAQLGGAGEVRPVSLSPDEIAREQLDRYMLRHTERAALSNGQGLISFARVNKLEAEE
jgi:sigma-E factor negative regulatory protein RseA